MKKVNAVFQIVMVVLTLTFSGCSNGAQGQMGVVNISADEVNKIMKEQNAVLIDVRTPGELSSGYIKGATVFANVNGSDFEAQMAKLDTSKVYIVYCRSGARSTTASNYMISKGFKHVYNLIGGIGRWNGETVNP